ncbi:MAG: hypothetical protein WDN27_00410 [Candidatus Saccharibacteria bacterium]
MAVAAGLFALLMVPWRAAAIQYGSGTYSACQYGSCSVSITTSSSVGISLTPSPTGSCSIQKDQVSVFTDNSNGFSLTLADSGTDTSLKSGAHGITASAGTLSSPVTLAINHWGYRVDGAGGFGSGPTSAQTDVSSSSLSFAGVPASNATADTLADTDAAADPAVVTSVWYGVCADTAVASGTYSTQVTYTAVAN